MDPAPPGSGVAFRLDVDVRSVPMYIYKTVGNFAAMMTQYVTQALREGPFGWRVTDCTVTMIDCATSPRPPRSPTSASSRPWS